MSVCEQPRPMGVRSVGLEAQSAGNLVKPKHMLRFYRVGDTEEQSEGSRGRRGWALQLPAVQPAG